MRGKGNTESVTKETCGVWLSSDKTKKTTSTSGKTRRKHNIPTARPRQWFQNGVVPGVTDLFWSNTPVKITAKTQTNIKSFFTPGRAAVKTEQLESEPDSTSYPPCCEALPPLKTNFERLNTNMNTDENDSRTFKNPLSESQNSGIFNSVDLKDFDFYAPSMSSSGLRADKENFPRTNSTEKSSKRKLSHLQNEKRSNFKDSSTICQKNSSKNRLENGKHHTDQDRNLSQMKSYPDITSAEFNSQSVHRQLDPGKKPFLDSESFQSTFQSYKSNDQTALSSFNNNRVGHCGSTLMNPCDSERVFDSDEQNQDSEGKVIAHSSQQSFSGFYSCEGLEDMSETEESQSKFLNRKDEVLSESLKLTQYIIENRRRQDYRPKNRKRTFTEASLEDGIQGNSGHSDSWLVTESLEIDTDIALSQESCDKESVFKSSKCPSFDLESQDLDSEDYSQSQFSDSDFAE